MEPEDSFVFFLKMVLLLFRLRLPAKADILNAYKINFGWYIVDYTASSTEALVSLVAQLSSPPV
jgi:hypothetical protein